MTHRLMKAKPFSKTRLELKEEQIRDLRHLLFVKKSEFGPSGKQSVPIKDLLLYPSRKDFRKILTAG